MKFLTEKYGANSTRKIRKAIKCENEGNEILGQFE